MTHQDDFAAEFLGQGQIRFSAGQPLLPLDGSLEHGSIGLEVPTHAGHESVDRVIGHHSRQIRHRFGRIVQSMDHQTGQSRRCRIVQASRPQEQSPSMRLWNAHFLIGCEPQSDLCVEIFIKLNSTLRSPKPGQVSRRVANDEPEHLRVVTFPTSNVNAGSALRKQWPFVENLPNRSIRPAAVRREDDKGN
jgi:hypothetical protein